MTNIKNIGKELLGKSLNSYHRRTGLTQLEENNKMQDGILNGILSQVDDAYIEKTEQSNVIHLDGSGDGVVVLDSIEGSTLVGEFLNIPTPNLQGNQFDNFTITDKGEYFECRGIANQDNVVMSVNSWSCRLGLKGLKANTVYTVVVYDCPINSMMNRYLIRDNNVSINLESGYGVNKWNITTKSDGLIYGFYTYSNGTKLGQECVVNFPKKVLLLEGDWTNKEVPPYFKGLQSSFEEKVSDEGKYEIEILSNNENLFDFNKENYNLLNTTWSVESDHIKLTGSTNNYPHICSKTPIRLKPNTDYTFFIDGYGNGNYRGINIGTTTHQDNGDLGKTTLPNTRSIVICNFRTDNKGLVYVHMYLSTPQDTIPTNYIYSCGIVQGKKNVTQIKKQKQNKIKLLINEPLRKINNTFKDKLCVVDGKLVVERRCGFKELGKAIYDEGFGYLNRLSDDYYRFQATESNKYLPNINTNGYTRDNINNFPIPHSANYEALSEGYYIDNSIVFRVHKDRIGGTNILDFRRWAKDKDLKIVYPLKNAYYEEVLNEYGEPILLEGYENGTIYIDSTIVPTTTVSYTPKMESFKTIKEVKDNNIMLTSDINDAIIPYMMEVDMMIMEKEMAIMSHKNIRKIGEKDMTSMQKRTYDMLARLIKGKTLTVNECKTRVTVYLNADKITDAQAKELNFLIDEIYA